MFVTTSYMYIRESIYPNPNRFAPNFKQDILRAKEIFPSKNKDWMKTVLPV